MALTNDEEVIVKKLALEKKIADAKEAINKAAIEQMATLAAQIKSVDNQRLADIEIQDSLLDK